MDYSDSEPIRARGIIFKYKAKPIYGSTPIYRSFISCSVSVTKLDKICNSKKESRLIDTHEYTSVSREVVGKVHAIIPKGIVGGFVCPVLQRNLKEWQERPRAYVREC